MSAGGSLQDRYTEVKQRVEAAAARAGNAPNRVILVAVTKNAEADAIRELVELGHRDFGENRVQQLVQRGAIVQEWFERARMLQRTTEAAIRGDTAGGAGFDPEQPVRWHMIGHLQRNKARKVADYCRLVHSVDSLRLAEELQTLANKRERVIDVLVQVNVSGEESKFGCPVAAAMPLCEQIETMVNVRVRGLMTIAPIGTVGEAARPYFVRCRELHEEIIKLNISEGRFDLLSMGMSGDYEVALEEGANIVRVGSAIFGEALVDDEAAEAAEAGA